MWSCSRNGPLVIYPKVYLQNSDLSKTWAHVIVRVLTDFEIIFTDDLSELLGNDHDFVSKAKRKNGNDPLLNSSEQSRAILALSFELIPSFDLYL